MTVSVWQTVRAGRQEAARAEAQGPGPRRGARAGHAEGSLCLGEPAGSVPNSRSPHQGPCTAATAVCAGHALLSGDFGVKRTSGRFPTARPVRPQPEGGPSQAGPGIRFLTVTLKASVSAPASDGLASVAQLLCTDLAFLPCERGRCAGAWRTRQGRGEGVRSEGGLARWERVTARGARRGPCGTGCPGCWRRPPGCSPCSPRLQTGRGCAGES